MESKIQKLTDNPNLRGQTNKILKNMIIKQSKDDIIEIMQILEMIEKGNAEEAGLLMRVHIISVRTMALENIDAMV